MSVSLVDTHAHLNGIEFEKDLDEAIQNARDSGVDKIVTIGTDIQSSRVSVELSEKYDCLVAAVGIHPCYVKDVQPADWDEIVALAKHPQVVAIGETGLDLYWDKTTLELQQTYFRKQIELSRVTNLPFIVHCRESEAEILTELRSAYQQAGSLSGIMHSYCGTLEGAQECLEMGMHVSFSGMVTFKKNESLRTLSQAIPDDRILVETDAPYLSPTPNRGKRNEPAYVRHTANCLADVRGVTLEDFSQMTTKNAKALFNF